MSIRDVIMRICCMFFLMIAGLSGCVLICNKFSTYPGFTQVVDQILKINPANALLMFVGGVGIGYLFVILLDKK